MLLLGAFHGATVGVGSPHPSELYLREIRPVLQARCYACHGVLQQKAGLRLDTAAFLLAGGTKGPVIEIGNPAKSRLMERILHADPEHRMPPEAAPLQASEIESIRRWILAGAPAPEHEEAEPDPRDHWAFQPIQRPAIPTASQEDHPVDAFLEAEWSSTGIQPVPSADRHILIRRAYLDLLGLPPTLDEQNAFLKDPDPQAWEHLIDRLLASPHYGERWGRHWMDIWRYSDWFGLGKQLRNSQKHLWHWRDWIIDSLNENKGYDQMILEMLAGDEIAPEDPKVWRATGFLARNYYLFNRDTWLDDTIEHTSKAFLGLTMNCVKCHDHKYDPFPQEDFYALRAFFEPHQVRLEAVPGVTDFEVDGIPRAFDDHPETPTYLFVRGDDKQPDKSRSIPPGIPSIFASSELKIQSVELPQAAFAPGTRPEIYQPLLDQSKKRIDQARKTLTQALQQEEQLAKSAETKPFQPKVWIEEDFSRARPDLWITEGEGWVYKNGHLEQTQPGTDRTLRSKQPHPRDFRAVLTYRPLGGKTWKSMSLRFDVVRDGKDSHTAYLSAHAPGPKAQISHTLNGANSYPAEGRRSMPVKLGEVQELEILVRDQLIHFNVNGSLAVAYHLPTRFPDGRIELSAFDLSAELLSFRLETLDPQIQLTPPGKTTTPQVAAISPTQAARNQLEILEAEHASLKARIQADLDRAREPESPTAKESARVAARAEASVAAIRARQGWESASAALRQIEQSKSKDDQNALQKARKQETDTKKAHDAAQKKVLEPGTDYSSIDGSLKALETPAHKFGQYDAFYHRSSTGRRTALARWIISSDNPLTARVAVNHIWMRHFGEPLVADVSDFGRRSPTPRHLKLLDFLASEFIEHGWDMKYLHALLMSSQAFQRSSSQLQAVASTLQTDPNNQLYWRMNPRRMESQIIRDASLHLAGKLDPQMGGPALSADSMNASSRRSIYFKHSRDDGSQFLRTFDDADINQCYRRAESVVPLQALALANAEGTLQVAEALASQWSHLDDIHTLVKTAFQAILSRPPDSTEMEATKAYLNEMQELLAGSPAEQRDLLLRARLAHAILNHNDFITIR